jgi:hypothetical protein
MGLSENRIFHKIKTNFSLNIMAAFEKSAQLIFEFL